MILWLNQKQNAAADAADALALLALALALALLADALLADALELAEAEPLAAALDDADVPLHPAIPMLMTTARATAKTA